MFSISFRKHHNEKKENTLLTLIIKNVISLLRALVLCLYRVIQTQFLTNQHMCFLRTVL